MASLLSCWPFAAEASVAGAEAERKTGGSIEAVVSLLPFGEPFLVLDKVQRLVLAG